MKTKKIIALLLALVMIASFSVSAFAASNEGYFGGGDAPDEFVPDTEEDDYYEGDDYYEDDGYEAVPEDNTQQDPVRLDDPSEYESNQTTAPQPSAGTTPMRTTKAISDKRERNSEDTKKVINSYGLSASAAKSLIAKHNDAAKGQGNREKDERYKRILKSNPNDYLAAYRLAQVNMAMGRKGQALGWVNQCLKIYPNYMPARRLRTKLGGK